jgi:hypothetical protein
MHDGDLYLGSTVIYGRGSQEAKIGQFWHMGVYHMANLLASSYGKEDEALDLSLGSSLDKVLIALPIQEQAGHSES